MNINQRDIDSVVKDNDWTFMNKILYQMCSRYPTHTDYSIIMAKVCIIGRSYSASIERRKTNPKKSGSNDFYGKIVAPQMSKSNIDKWINDLRRFRVINKQNLLEMVNIHFKVMKLLNKISGMNKRSLASKYLHFHLPNLFYIYDSRAVKGLSNISPNLRIKDISKVYDKEYYKFFLKLFSLQKEIEKKYNKKLSPRQLDRLLLLKA